MTSRVPIVKDTYFQHKVLTRVHGQPHYESLKILLDELKANASSVPSTLGGGAYGHLGLLLTDTRYATLSPTPFVVPDNPGPFAPPAAGTGPQIEAAKDVWRDAKTTFEICQATEKALIAQVVDAVDATYLAALRNADTSRYGDSIRLLVEHLFATYGKITPQQIKIREGQVFNMSFDMNLPVDAVFNAVDNLYKLADHAQMPMTLDQCINLAYMVFARQPVLLHDLRAWNCKPSAEKTWTNLKTHMREAQNDLRSLPVAGSMYGHAPNPHLIQQANYMGSILPSPDPHTYMLPPPPTYTSPPPLTDATTPASDASTLTNPTAITNFLANSMQQRENDLQSREQQLLLQMQDMMSRMLSSTNNDNTHSRNTRNRSQGSRQANSSERQRQTDRTKKYCWTHGACAHTGTECLNKAAGHKPQATFANMESGSTTGCFWLNT